ncbi:MAG: 50S ribosomal protein L16 [Candidatus Aenigmatarchaeota archaeon]
MAKERPWRCYRDIKRPYTRRSVSVPSKDYIKGVPQPRIAQFEMGKKKDYEYKLYLVAENYCQIRHTALEAARMTIVKTLEKSKEDYFVKLRVYPHHVYRENPLATGAGADRYQQGMRLSFGNPIGTACQVDKGQKIFEIRVDAKLLNVAKDALRKAKQKLPLRYKIVVEQSKKI